MCSKLQAYKALGIAAERIGLNNYLAGCKDKRTKKYVPTDAHRDVVEAMRQVLSGDITPDEAMTLLRRADVEQQRFTRLPEKKLNDQAG